MSQVLREHRTARKAPRRLQALSRRSRFAHTRLRAQMCDCTRQSGARACFKPLCALHARKSVLTESSAPARHKLKCARLQVSVVVDAHSRHPADHSSAAAPAAQHSTPVPQQLARGSAAAEPTPEAAPVVPSAQVAQGSVSANEPLSVRDPSFVNADVSAKAAGSAAPAGAGSAQSREGAGEAASRRVPPTANAVLLSRPSAFAEDAQAGESHQGSV